MSNNYDEDRAPEGAPRCRICQRASDAELCADCHWHTHDEPARGRDYDRHRPPEVFATATEHKPRGAEQ